MRETQPLPGGPWLQVEEILYQPMPVLDHGFVRVIDYMGDDAAVVQAARVSYGRGTKSVSEDRGLIQYLMRHGHTTPFEMCEIKFHVKLPIFVARQWIRHRTANVNEYSARYSILDKEFYIPAPGSLGPEGRAIHRKARGEGQGPFRRDQQARLLEGADAVAQCGREPCLRADAERVYTDYRRDAERRRGRRDAHPNERQGLARESGLRSLNLSLNFYTQWYWKTDLFNLMNFLAFVPMRMPNTKSASMPTRCWSMIGTLGADDGRGVPSDYRMGGAHISQKGLAVV